MNNLNLQQNELGKEKKTKHKGSRTKKIIKIRVEINKIESKNNIKCSNTKSWFLENINKR